MKPWTRTTPNSHHDMKLPCCEPLWTKWVTQVKSAPVKHTGENWRIQGEKNRLPYKVLLKSPSFPSSRVNMQIGTSTSRVIETHPNTRYPNLHLKLWPHQGTNPDQYIYICFFLTINCWKRSPFFDLAIAGSLECCVSVVISTTRKHLRIDLAQTKWCKLRLKSHRHNKVMLGRMPKQKWPPMWWRGWWRLLKNLEMWWLRTKHPIMFLPHNQLLKTLALFWSCNCGLSRMLCECCHFDNTKTSANRSGTNEVMQVGIEITPAQQSDARSNAKTKVATHSNPTQVWGGEVVERNRMQWGAASTEWARCQLMLVSVVLLGYS